MERKASTHFNLLQSLMLQIAANWIEQEKKDIAVAKEAYMAENCPAPDLSGDLASLMVRPFWYAAVGSRVRQTLFVLRPTRSCTRRSTPPSTKSTSRATTSRLKFRKLTSKYGWV